MKPVCGFTTQTQILPIRNSHSRLQLRKEKKRFSLSRNQLPCSADGTRKPPPRPPPPSPSPPAPQRKQKQEVTAGLAAAEEISKDAALLPPQKNPGEQRAALTAAASGLPVWTRNSGSRLNWQSGRAVGSLQRNGQKVDPINRQVSLSVGAVPDGYLRWIQRI